MSSTKDVTLIFSKCGQLLMQFGDTAALTFGDMALAASCYALHQSGSVDYSKSVHNNVFLVGYRPHSGRFDRGVFFELNDDDVEKMVADYMALPEDKKKDFSCWSVDIVRFILQLAAIRIINKQYSEKLMGECHGK